MSRYLRLALEENISDAGTAVNTNEYDLARLSQEMDAAFEDGQAISVVMENLKQCISVGESFIENNTCTPETLAMLRLGVEQQFNRLHHVSSRVGFEDHDADIVRQHEIVLESARDATLAWQQTQVVSFKQSMNSIGDFFRSVDGQVNKYRSKLTETKEEFVSKKNSFQSVQHRTSLVELWYHFADEHGPTANITQATRKDLELSHYVLNVYVGTVAKAMGRLNSVLRSAHIKNVGDAEKLFIEIEKMATGSSMFNKKYLGGYPFFSATGLIEKKGDLRHEVNVNGRRLSKLAALASPATIVETVSRYHEKQKVSYNIKGNVARVKFLEEDLMVKVTTNEIGDLIEAGLKYLENVDAYKTHSRQFVASVNDAMKSISTLMAETGDKIKGKDVSVIEQALKQVEQYVQNIVHCYQNPAEAEIARSIKGAKYLMYLTLRLIHNAE